MTQIAYDMDAVGLFLDIDGTLLDIAAKPHEVVVPDELVADLAALSKQLDGALALVSGRTIADIDSLFGSLRPRASGGHGAELRANPGGHVELATEPVPDTVREELEELASRNKGVMVEDKGVCIAVHYREEPTIGTALHLELAAILDGLGDRTLGILPGRLVYEIKHVSHDKGTAVRAFMATPPFHGRRPMFIGDDVTDQAGFAAAQAAGGFAYSVGRDYPGVKRGFDTPADVRAWIGATVGKAEAA
ncbi:trehalose-phosphatase [Chelatococcus reniformis]|uniref:Trehalose 6-phosphate phosphatase n=1 Tax=Chelatococcus reniformis TaxID=1494448 RepID=A0A916U095_9HYPH|nr:trehalose-phosphatase [Chelatococcus reniformis]GGC54641.1 trehalose 6-phosphate phosphatase [Chelatococcus reniformis]